MEVWKKKRVMKYRTCHCHGNKQAETQTRQPGELGDTNQCLEVDRVRTPTARRTSDTSFCQKAKCLVSLRYEHHKKRAANRRNKHNPNNPGWTHWSINSRVTTVTFRICKTTIHASTGSRNPKTNWLQTEHVSYSGEFRLSPSVVRSLPRARCTIPGSVSAARINVSRPIMPNWSVTIPEGMFVTRPAAKQLRVTKRWNASCAVHSNDIIRGSDAIITVVSNTPNRWLSL